MMKKLFALMLCAAMLSSITGCASEHSESSAPTTEWTEPSTRAATEETAKETEPETAWQEPAPGEEIRLLYDETLSTGEVCQVPLLRCAGGDSAKVNRELREKYGAVMERVLAGKAPEIKGLSYETHRFRIYTLSLIIRCDFADGSCDYSVYTLSLETGRLLTNAEILEELNISQESFLSSAKTRAAEVFEALCADAEQEESCSESLAASNSEKNINLDMQMFIDTDGHLKLISLFQLPEGIRLKTVYSLHKEFDDF